MKSVRGNLSSRLMAMRSRCPVVRLRRIREKGLRAARLRNTLLCIGTKVDTHPSQIPLDFSFNRTQNRADKLVYKNVANVTNDGSRSASSGTDFHRMADSLRKQAI